MERGLQSASKSIRKKTSFPSVKKIIPHSPLLPSV